MAKKLMKKICLLGDGAVGKTSLIKKFVFDKFDDKYIMTFGTKVSKKQVELSQGENDYALTFLIWDILGQRVHNNLHATYYSGSAGAFIVCDVSRQETIDNVDEWITVFRDVNKEAPLIILGNKSDKRRLLIVFSGDNKVQNTRCIREKRLSFRAFVHINDVLEIERWGDVDETARIQHGRSMNPTLNGLEDLAPFEVHRHEVLVVG